MELRDITRIDELSELVSTSSFDEFYQKIVEENRKYDEEYYEAFKSLRLAEIKGLKRIVFGNWAIFGKIMRLWHRKHGFKYPKEYYQKQPFLWIYERCKQQVVPDESTDMKPFFASAKDIYNNIGQYASTYELLADDASKSVLIGLLAARLTGDIRHLTDLTSGNPQYFDGDIMKTYENEVVVDAGGFVGDTALSLLGTPEAKGNIKKIYLYEPSANNMERAKKNLSKYGVEIVFRKAGVSDSHGTLFIAGTGSSSHLTADKQKAEKIDIVTLDEDIEEKITFIKMDIEGSERAALQGCRRHILEDSPKLAICVYHKFDDVWRLPQYIKSLNPEYEFYLRHYRASDITETVMYCLPR